MGTQVSPKQRLKGNEKCSYECFLLLCVCVRTPCHTHILFLRFQQNFCSEHLLPCNWKGCHSPSLWCSFFLAHVPQGSLTLELTYSPHYELFTSLLPSISGPRMPSLSSNYRCAGEAYFVPCYDLVGCCVLLTRCLSLDASQSPPETTALAEDGGWVSYCQLPA